MQYLHSCPKYNKDIKVPKVYAWDLSHDNKAGAPYILREVIEGKDLSREFDSLTDAQKLAVTTEIARVHKVLSQPAEFNSIGGIYWSHKRGFHTGGYPGNWSRSEPYSSIEELWREKLDSSTGHAGKEYSGRLVRNQCQLRNLTSKFSPPGRLSRLCIQHFDLAIRNVVFNDNFKITGVIDWEYAQVVPLAVAAKIPLDFVNDPVLSSAYATAFNDAKLETSHQDFDDSIDYIHFHDLIMGPDHATAKKYVSNWIEGLTSYFARQQNGSAQCNGAILRFPAELRALRRLEGEGPELAGNGCS
ncbi:hypothetical protein BDZ91DRAFT_758959 [Kalaharituber pfeilii]|nr:hypothetical protein BDZ91DRAFT_758959 [Kalaharituber pfeilii]